MLEQVARAIAIGSIARKWPNAKSDFVADKVENCWRVYEPDARLVITVINRMVEAEALMSDVEQMAKESGLVTPPIFQ